MEVFEKTPGWLDFHPDPSKPKFTPPQGAVDDVIARHPDFDAGFLALSVHGEIGLGNMPAVEGVTDGDVKLVVAYIRELQRTNGIY